MSQVETFFPARPSAQELLRQLLDTSIVLREDWETLSESAQARIVECADTEQLLVLLQQHSLLNPYQADRIKAGTMHGLILGNYRVIDRLGAGGMGVVFKAEHCRMRRLVAVKVVPLHPEQDRKILLRFLAEMRAVAQLQHPNIVGAFDAGELSNQGRGRPDLHYFVMEYVPGEDLEEYVRTRGPLSISKTCDVAFQIADALAEADKNRLVHRDIKPSNIRMTADDQAKLLDFGLARHFSCRHTEPGVVLGTIDYMAPEQAQDASSVDIRADIYALGATMFWCLTGESPFPADDNLIQALSRRAQQPAPCIRQFNPDIPVELEAVLCRMLALKPDDRYATPHAVMHALLPFLNRESVAGPGRPVGRSAAEVIVPNSSPTSRSHKILIVDDDSDVRSFSRRLLESEGFVCAEAPDGASALQVAQTEPCDLALLDIDMPRMTGPEVLRHLRERPPTPHLKVIMFSGRASSDEMATMLLAGADGYLTKPFSKVQLTGQIRAALRLKGAQDRADLLNRRLVVTNAELERGLGARDSDLVHARNGLVLSLATLVKHRDGETGAHVWRLQRYCRVLAEEAATLPSFSSQIDGHFIDLLECCAPLHDIGKVGLPDHILLKPGKLTPDERLLMQSHTIIGAETLKEVAEHHGSALAFLQTAIDIARHHHERFDGTGYPDRLTGTDIPLAARIVAICDVYDALRSRRVYKPALSHATATQLMAEGSPGHFDPALMQAFLRCADRFDGIFNDVTEAGT